MTLKNDRSAAAKMVACAELIRRLERRGIDSVLPETASKLRADDGESTRNSVTAYITLDAGGPIEYEAIAYDPRGEHDINPNEFAFAMSIAAEDDLDRAAVTAAHNRLGDLLAIHGGEL